MLHVVFGAGQVGGHIISQLSEAGHRVRVVRRTAGRAPAGVDVTAIDAHDKQACVRAAKGAAVIYHCLNVPYTARAWAAQLPRLQDNLIAAAASTGARLVVLENLYMYGRPQGVIHGHSPIAPVTEKGRIRAALSDGLWAAHRKGIVQAVSGRASHLFGPGVTQSLVGEHLYRRVLNGKSAQFFGDLQARHSFAYAPDVAKGLIELALADEDAVGRPHVLPVMPPLPSGELLLRLLAALGVEARIERMPGWAMTALKVFVPVLRELAELRYEWDFDYRVDDSAFCARFRHFQATSLDTALRLTAAWARPVFARRAA